MADAVKTPVKRSVTATPTRAGEPSASPVIDNKPPNDAAMTS